MRLVVFGLTISSSWGNGHATLWRGLCRAMARRGHSLVFYEHDAPYYRANRDLWYLTGGELVLYGAWAEVRSQAAKDIAAADVAMVTSYCPHGREAAELVLAAPRAMSVFYDLDTPVTLARLQRGESVSYIGPQGLAGFDLVLSYTGGKALDALRSMLRAKRVAPLYGHVDPDVHRPAGAAAHYVCDLSYLGTYAADRQERLADLFVEAALRRPQLRFLIGGAQYPETFPWAENIHFVRHLPPEEHPAFFCSSRLTLNVTRPAMAEMGWCPSGRLFEATACGAAVVSDQWEGLDSFFEPGVEILVAEKTADTLETLELSDAELGRIRAAGRARTLADHTAASRLKTLEDILESVRSPADVVEA